MNHFTHCLNSCGYYGADFQEGYCRDCYEDSRKDGMETLALYHQDEPHTAYEGDLTPQDIRAIRKTVLNHTPVSVMQLTPRAENALLSNDLKTLGDVIQATPAQIANLYRMGPVVKADIVRRFKADLGITLKRWME